MGTKNGFNISTKDEVFIDVHLQVNEELSIDDEALIMETIEENIDKSTKHFNIDISVYYQVDGDSAVYLTKIPQLIDITIVIPEEYRGYDKYYIVRIHDGVSELLEVNHSEENQTLTFQTDRFSTYSVVYETGTNWKWGLLSILFIPIMYFLAKYKQ